MEIGDYVCAMRSMEIYVMRWYEWQITLSKWFSIEYIQRTNQVFIWFCYTEHAFLYYHKIQKIKK